MDRVHAPYGFVPLSRHVFLPPWRHEACQDLPIQDGLRGRVDVELEAVTPLFVRGTGDPSRFFATPDGTPAIPGSALRGLLRNTLEIASFGWMKRVNDHRYGVRDLNNHDVYGRHMSAIALPPGGKEKVPIALVISGWLKKETQASVDKVATITPCHFAKIEYHLIQEFAQKVGFDDYDPRPRQSAVRKYLDWGARSREVDVDIRDLRPAGHVTLPYRYGLVKGAGKQRGTLVFTGQPAPWNPDRPPRRAGGNPKHHDFVFYDAPGAVPIPVTDTQFKDFEFVHSDSGQRHSLNRSLTRNEEWKYWGERYDRGEKVPVFFLTQPGSKNLRAFGLAMMFRLAYDHTVGEAVRAGQPDLAEQGEKAWDLAETLFGHVPMGSGKEHSPHALKGRVAVTLATPAGSPRVLDRVKAVLGTPKGSYYPGYIEQRADGPGLNPGMNPGGKPAWATLMDQDAVVRGWKRYRIHERAERPVLPTRGDGSPMDISKVGTEFCPLDKGTRFSFSLRLHNVKPEELGALLWVLDFGQDDSCLHTLGMARSLGYGACRLRVKGHELIGMDDIPFTDLDEARRAFIRSMEDFARERNITGGWALSRQIFELKALARPMGPDSPDRFHMSIRTADRRNQFQDAKLAGLALPAAGSDAAWRKALADAGLVEAAPAKPAPAQARVTQAPPRSTPWKGLMGGTRVKVRLTGLSKKGKWMAALCDFPARGVIQGDPPAGAAEGQEHQVVVVAGNDPTNLGMKWG